MISTYTITTWKNLLLFDKHKLDGYEAIAGMDQTLSGEDMPEFAFLENVVEQNLLFKGVCLWRIFTTREKQKEKRRRKQEKERKKKKRNLKF